MNYLQGALWLGGVVLSVIIVKMFFAWLFRPVFVRFGLMRIADMLGQAGESAGYASRWAIRTRWFSWAWYVSLAAAAAQGTWQGHTYTGAWGTATVLVGLSWIGGAVLGGLIDGLLRIRRAKQRDLARRV